jgi:hypothetical protein
MLTLVKQLYNNDMVSSSAPGLTKANRIAKSLPKGLDMSSDRMQFERAYKAKTLTVERENHQYTDIELQQALRANLIDGMTYKDCSSEYGLPEKTLRRHIARITTEKGCATRKDMIVFSKESDANRIRMLAALDRRQIPTTGPPPLHTQTEVDLFFSIASIKNAAGSNQGRGAVAKSFMHLNEAKSKDGPDKERYQKSTCSKTYMRKQKRRISPSIQLAGGARFKRNSPISLKRAEAANPILQLVMEGKINKWYNYLRSLGVIIPEDGPPPEQKWNGDEKGLSTNAKFPPSFTLGGNNRTFTIVPGEKSNFWTTLFFWICGNGDLPVPPTVVHQGGTETHFPTRFLHGLPNSWTSHNTPSGYMDKSGFYLCVLALVLYIRERDGDNLKPQFVFLDGFDGHFSADALDLAHANNIHIFFLKSNDSINDQPADMGANAMIEKYFQLAMLDWKEKFAMTPFTPMFMNEVLVTAYNAFLKDAKVCTCTSLYELSYLF